MVQRTYAALGAPEAAAREFEGLRPFVRALWGLQAAVGYFTRDGSAIDIALDSLQTAAFHFTRRPYFYGPRDPLADAADLRERAAVAGAFEALRPYASKLRLLQGRCRPFGQDWQALQVALQGLETMAFHFTQVAQFYGARADSAGPTRPPGRRGAMTRYAELQAVSNFSFLRGASHPGELMVGAAALGLEAVGVCDRNTLAGVVRAWSAARDLVAEGGARTRALTGCRLDFVDGTPSLLVYPSDREAYGRLTRLLTVGQLRTAKGGCELHWTDFLDHAEGQLVLVDPPARLDGAFEAGLAKVARAHPDVWLAASRRYGARDLHRLSRLSALAVEARVFLVATNDVLYHGPERRMLQDVLTCVREGRTIQQIGLALQANAERHLKSAGEMARLFLGFPGAVERSLDVVGRIEFDLGQLRYEYPSEPVPPGKTAIQHLRDLAWEGAAWRFPDGVPEKVRTTIEKELALIERLNFPNYFLTVHDIVRWARSEGILCQGRGSAANSCVCFCLGVTAVDPTKKDQDLLFSRFISESRGESPDIDVDFEHERREEVMQYIYRRYGRERAAIVATVIHYRPRMAIREVGKALGLTEDVTAALAGTVWGSYGEGVPDEHIRQTGLDPEAPEIKRATTLAHQLLGFPRHLSQHVGGYVLTQRRLDETVPIGNAAMPDRTFIEWDKDDIDALGLMKVDVLALGMLTALKSCLTTLGLDDIADIPQEEPCVYDMLCKADSVGVFQVESRAQMSMLPRLKPRRFYDLVIEVAIVRPGPIQGDMVHPYLRRREGTDPVSYPKQMGRMVRTSVADDDFGVALRVVCFQNQDPNEIGREQEVLSVSRLATKVLESSSPETGPGLLAGFSDRVAEGPWTAALRGLVPPFIGMPMVFLRQMRDVTAVDAASVREIAAVTVAPTGVAGMGFAPAQQISLSPLASFPIADTLGCDAITTLKGPFWVRFDFEVGVGARL